MNTLVFRTKLKEIDKEVARLKTKRAKLVLKAQAECSHPDIAYFCELRCTGSGYNNGFLCMDCGAEAFGWTAPSDSEFGRSVGELDCRKERITYRQFFELGVR